MSSLFAHKDHNNNNNIVHLSQLIKEHNQTQAQQREENDRQRKLAKLSMNNLTNELVHSTNESIGIVFRNQQALGAETKALSHNTQLFIKNSQSWIQSFQQMNNALKELGDVDNWANHLIGDVDQVANHVSQIISHQRGKQQVQQQQQQQVEEQPSS